MKKVLVIGDIMVDRYVYLRTDRLAPESKLPVWDVVRIEERPGGAANVAANIRAMSPPDWEVRLCGLGGMSIDGVKRACLVIPPIQESMCKTRYVDAGTMQHLLRVDNFTDFKHSDAVKLAKPLKMIMDRHGSYDALVVSDYDKGTVTEQLLELVSGVPLKIVDSKRVDLGWFSGYDVLKVNEDEHRTQLECKLLSSYSSVEQLFKCVVVTKGADGAEVRVNAPELQQGHVPSPMAVARYSTHVVQVPVQPVDEVVDVTGCGDTHTAAMAVAILSGADMIDAVDFANRKARSVVVKFGTSTPEEER